MYDRFTIRARQVMQSANKEAERFEHEYIAPEHILSGLLKVGDCLATTILNNLGVDLQKAVGDSETTLQSLQKKSPTELPRAKMVIESAMMEARYLSHNYVGTAQLLLGILHARSGDSGNALVKQNMTIYIVREEIKKTMPDANPPKSEGFD